MLSFMTERLKSKGNGERPVGFTYTSYSCVLLVSLDGARDDSFHACYIVNTERIIVGEHAAYG